ncbi:hypothetical protein BD413DRAFT_514196 [Trametes elegans]|nr:hypothetical protein BD413DRAFT_514196 [Trametes elegans]
MPAPALRAALGRASGQYTLERLASYLDRPLIALIPPRIGLLGCSFLQYLPLSARTRQRCLSARHRSILRRHGWSSYLHGGASQTRGQLGSTMGPTSTHTASHEDALW